MKFNKAIITSNNKKLFLKIINYLFRNIYKNQMKIINKKMIKKKVVMNAFKFI